MIYLTLFTIGFMVATIVPFGSEMYFATLLAMNKYNSILFISLSVISKLSSKFLKRLFSVHGMRSSQGTSNLVQGRTDLYRVGNSLGTFHWVHVRIENHGFQRWQEVGFTTRAPPNGRFPGNFPFGRGKADPAPNCKISHYIKSQHLKI